MSALALKLSPVVLGSAEAAKILSGMRDDWPADALTLLARDYMEVDKIKEALPSELTCASSHDFGAQGGGPKGRRRLGRRPLWWLWTQ